LTTTSSADLASRVTELRRLRTERLLQATTRDFDLRFLFGRSDRLGSGQIQMKSEDASVGEFSPLKAEALHLLGHYLAESQPFVRLAEEEEDKGKPGFAALWHALEDARVENRLVERWPGMRRAFEARTLPNLGGSLVRLMSFRKLVEMGLYLEGRGYRHAQYDRRVRAALEEAGADIAAGAAGQSPQASLEAMRSIYPEVAGLWRFGRGGGRELEHEDSEKSGLAGTDMGKKPDAGNEGPLEIQVSDELVEVGVMGRGRGLPQWYRPGSAPWFERNLGEKQVHPSAVRSDAQSIATPPQGDFAVYRALWAEVQREVGFLAARMTNLLREESYLRYGGQFRSGKLHTAKLWKQRLGNHRLFERRVAGERSAAFLLLVDESASMKGQDKYRVAAKTALLLGETLTQMCLPLEIIGFTTADFEARAAMQLGLTPAHEYRTMRCSALQHRIYKRFDEPYPLVRRRLAGIEPRHNNWDEEHVLFAFRRIRARRERLKVIIVISDGQPNGDANHLIATVAAVEDLGCKIIGVGIGADFVRQIYRNAIVVADFRQLAEELLSVLARELGRAGPGRRLPSAGRSLEAAMRGAAGAG
jgi:hypothetical protein